MHSNIIQITVYIEDLLKGAGVEGRFFLISILSSSVHIFGLLRFYGAALSDVLVRSYIGICSNKKWRFSE